MLFAHIVRQVTKNPSLTLLGKQESRRFEGIEAVEEVLQPYRTALTNRDRPVNTRASLVSRSLRSRISFEEGDKIINSLLRRRCPSPPFFLHFHYHTIHSRRCTVENRSSLFLFFGMHSFLLTDFLVSQAQLGRSDPQKGA